MSINRRDYTLVGVSAAGSSFCAVFASLLCFATFLGSIGSCKSMDFHLLLDWLIMRHFVNIVGAS